MRIAVIGPQNAGKTTFIKDFLKEFTSYETTKDTYRDHVAEIGLPINQETNESSQRAILDFLYNQTIDNRNENVIFDRCVVDNYVYTHSAYLRGRASKELLLLTEGKMYDQLTQLDCLVFIPTSAGVKLENDSFRDIDTGFVDAINRLFIEALLDIAGRTSMTIFVVTGNREERVSIVRQKISQNKD